MTIRTVKTLTEVPGAYERGRAELVRILSSRYGVRFYVDNEPEPIPTDDPSVRERPDTSGI